jgi:restriction system protein
MMEEYQPLLEPQFVGRREELERLDHLVTFSADSHWPIFVVGAPGVGKTALVRKWLASSGNGHRRSWRTGRLVPFWLPLSSQADAKKAVDAFIKQLYDDTASDEIRRQESVVVIDDADALSDSEIKDSVGRLFNLKRIRSVIFTSRRPPSIGRAEIMHLTGFGDGESEALLRLLTGNSLSTADLADAVAATHGFPLAAALLARLHEGDRGTTISRLLAQPLYSAPEAAGIPGREIVTAVAPRIVTASEALVQQLKKHPDGVFDLPPRKFEELLAELLVDMGWRVELTPATRDGGKDLLAYLDTEVGEILCLVEAKKHRRDRKVGIDLVRTLYGTLCDYQANSAMLVTTSSFTPDAKEFQRKHQYQLSLKDYVNVVDWIKRYKVR